MVNNISYQVAFVGAGYMTVEHIKAFNDIPDVVLAGIYSRTKLRAEMLAVEFKIDSVCGSIAELYAKTKAELVVISVPELSVREVCLEAFKYPWMCLIEKPAGYDLADAVYILNAAKKLKRRAFVALNRRHYSSTQFVLKNINKQKSPRLIHVYDQEDQISARRAGQPELVVENWMYANSIHSIDLFSLLARGKIVSITPVIQWTPDAPNFVMAKIIYDSGDIGIYEAVWNSPGPWAVTITTHEKRWEMRPLEQVMVQSFGTRNLEPVVLNEWDTRFKPGLRFQAGEAVKALRGQKHNLPSLADAVRSMKLIHAIYGNSL
jgi:predicted dehydrogenase